MWESENGGLWISICKISRENGCRQRLCWVGVGVPKCVCQDEKCISWEGHGELAASQHTAPSWGSSCGSSPHFFFFNTWTIPDPLFWVETNLCFGRELFPISSLSEEKITFAPCSGNCTSQNFTFPSPDSKVVPGRMSCGSERGCALLPHLLWGLPGLAVSLDAWWEQSKTAVMAWAGIPKINIKRKRGSCPNTACKPLILCDSDTLSQVISSINVAAVMEAADSVGRRRFDGSYNNLS